MLNQTNQLQNRIDTGFAPIGLDMPYRVFISEDPIRFAGGINFYAYVGNNPLNRIDPLGLMFCNGTWKQRGFVFTWIDCTCYWVCIPCDGPVIISPNPRLGVPTKGTTYYNNWTGGYDCNCKKPGPEADCDEDNFNCS